MRYIVELSWNGRIVTHIAENGNEPSMRQIKRIIGNNIIAHPTCFNNCIMICRDPSVQTDKPINDVATLIFKEDTIRGNAILAKESHQTIMGIKKHDLEMILADLLAESDSMQEGEIIA